ncbi:nuclear pore complex protein DDB_G0274915-like isoform X2 [Portunus trituberculatus]|nr:nuclear pore complex protein DDB_G0274915-like isoform X2 [Portunus trituberculatus]
MNFPEVRAMGGSMGGMGMGGSGLPTHTPTPTASATDTSLPPVSPPIVSPSEATPYVGFQATSALSSPPAVSHPSLASMWGIGGFTTPPLPPPPPVVCPNTIASTLGIPQMPNVTYFNSRAPMGFHSSKPMAKQHISEERMTAHLNSLHLSDSYCNHRLGKGKPYRNRTSSKELDDDDDDEEDEGMGGDGTMDSDLQGARLIIADEVKKIVPGEAKLPESILQKLTKPSMEVVLWQPPPSILGTIITPNIDAKIKASENAAENADPSPATSTPSSNATTSTSPSIPSSSSSLSSTTTCTSSSSASSSSSSSSSSPDSGISISSPPPALSFLGRNSVTSLTPSTSAAGGTSSELGLDLLSLPSTSSGSRGSGFPPPPLRRPASPLPDPMVEDDFSERMEFNNNNGNAPNFMWLEENNNTALIDLNAVEPQRAAAAAAPQPPLPEDVPDFPDYDDMDL